jgi:hypothetical protein
MSDTKGCRKAKRRQDKEESGGIIMGLIYKMFRFFIVNVYVSVI